MRPKPEVKERYRLVAPMCYVDGFGRLTYLTDVTGETFDQPPSREQCAEAIIGFAEVTAATRWPVSVAAPYIAHEQRRLGRFHFWRRVGRIPLGAPDGESVDELAPSADLADVE